MNANDWLKQTDDVISDAINDTHNIWFVTSSLAYDDVINKMFQVWCCLRNLSQIFKESSQRRFLKFHLLLIFTTEAFFWSSPRRFSSNLHYGGFLLIFIIIFWSFHTDESVYDVQILKVFFRREFDDWNLIRFILWWKKDFDGNLMKNYFFEKSLVNFLIFKYFVKDHR